MAVRIRRGISREQEMEALWEQEECEKLGANGVVIVDEAHSHVAILFLPAVQILCLSTALFFVLGAWSSECRC